MRILASRSVRHMSLHAPFCSRCRNLPVVYRTIHNTYQMRADYRQGTERTPRYQKFCANVLNFFGELFVLFYTLILGQNSRPLRALFSQEINTAHTTDPVTRTVLPWPAMAQNMEYSQPSCFFGLPCCRHCNTP